MTGALQRQLSTLINQDTIASRFPTEKSRQRANSGADQCCENETGNDLITPTFISCENHTPAAVPTPAPTPAQSGRTDAGFSANSANPKNLISLQGNLFLSVGER